MHKLKFLYFFGLGIYRIANSITSIAPSAIPFN